MHRMKVRVAGGASPTWPDVCSPPTQPGPQGCQGRSGLAQCPSGLPLLYSTHGRLSHPWGSRPTPGHPGLSAVHIRD